MKIYLVTEGSYSAYTVLGAYSTKEQAEAAKDCYATTNPIEEYELNAPLPDHAPGTRMYRVDMKRNGDVVACVHDYMKERSDLAGVGWPVKSHLRADGSRIPWFTEDSQCQVAYFSFRLWAVDEQAAIKIANERRLALIANGDWSGNFQQDYQRYAAKVETSHHPQEVIDDP